MEADKNSLDWWRAKKKEYPKLARLARKYLGVPDTSELAESAWHQHTGREYALVDGVALEQEEAEHVRGHFVRAAILER